MKTLIDLLASLNNPGYHELPEIELYMDQVLTYIKKHLPPIKPNDKDILTGSMINNYVKDHVIPNPIDKKYNKDAIASLFMVANLKRVLPISDIKQILSGSELSNLYQIYQRQLNDNINTIKETDTLSSKVNKSDLKEVALALAVDASIKSYLAHMILIDKEEPIKEKKKKDSKEKK